jgi:hypothetical protein
MAAIKFMVGFIWSNPNPKKCFEDLFPQNSFVVTKVRKVGKEDNQHVSLSTSDAAYKLCSDYRCLLPKDNQRDILKVTSPETAVRYKILTVIAIKLDKRYSTNKSYVDYLKVKTHLFLFKEGAYKQYRFSAAIQKLRTLIGNSDLKNVHKFALSKNIQEASVIVCTCCTLLVSLNTILMQVTLNKNSGELYHTLVINQRHLAQQLIFISQVNQVNVL